MVRAHVRTARFAAHTIQTLLRWELRTRIAHEREIPEIRDRYKRRTARGVLAILGVDVDADPAPPPQGRPRLIVANHRTALDIGVLMSLLGGTFLSRADLAEWPVVGPLAKAGNTIFVDRESKASGAKAIRLVRRHLKQGEDVIVFPEGSTFRGDEVRPFRAGAFVAARGLEVDILPVGLAYPAGVEYVDVRFVEHVRSIAGRPSTAVAVRFGSMWHAEGSTTEMAARSEEEVRQLVGRARRAHEQRQPRTSRARE